MMEILSLARSFPKPPVDAVLFYSEHRDEETEEVFLLHLSYIFYLKDGGPKWGEEKKPEDVMLSIGQCEIDGKPTVFGRISGISSDRGYHRDTLLLKLSDVFGLFESLKKVVLQPDSW